MAGEAFNWTEDAHAVGVYYNHQLSRKLLELALPACLCNQFVHDHGLGFKRQAGETVNIMHVSELPDANTDGLSEDDQFPIHKPAFASRALTLKEYGEGVQTTELMKVLSVFNPDDILQKRLRRQMERALDTMAANAFKDPTGVKIVFIPTSRSGGVWDVDGTPSTLALSALTLDHCKKISAYMRDIIHVPYYEAENFVGLSSNTNIESLLDDPRAERWQQYGAKMDFMYRGEMCMTYKIRWVETNRQGAFSNTAGNCSVLGESVVFGDEAVARIEALAPHLRLSANYQGRFGTKQAAAWYAILAYGSVWNTANDGESKIIRVGSA
jgi:N4-gp56 family major capsid protein